MDFDDAMEQASVDPQVLLKWAKENAPGMVQFIEHDLKKNLTLGDVHVGTALGNEDEKSKRKKTKATLLSVLTGNLDGDDSVSPADKRFEPESETFDSAGSSSRAFDWWMDQAKSERPADPVSVPAEVGKRDKLEDRKAIFEYHLTKGPERCGSCRYFDGKSSECMLYEELNDTLGKDFSLDEDVQVNGWCTAYMAEDVEKLKVKIKVEAEPEELKALMRGGNIDKPQNFMDYISQAVTASAAKPTVEKASRTLKVIRHGATHLNNQDTSVDRIRGWKNVPLSAEGREEAQKAADKIAKDPPDHLVCSDLKRAHDTAKYIAKACGIKIDDVSQTYRPWNVGDFAGKSSKDAVPILCRYAVETPDKKVPGGESFNEFRQRFFTGLSADLQKYDGVLGVVTHHRGERLLTAWLSAGAPADGTIDGKEFTKKGEGTAGHEDVEIPVDRLHAAAKAVVTKWINPPEDFDKIWQEDHQFEFTIAKVDREQQMVFGIWSVTTINDDPVVDKQDDIIPTEELEKAVYDWVLQSRTQGEMHELMKVGRCVESMMFTKEKCAILNKYLADMGAGQIDPRMEFWWGGFKVDDAQTWADIKAGKLPEFSIGGSGTRMDSAVLEPPAPPAIAAKVETKPPEPVVVNVSVAPAAKRIIKMRRDENGNLIAEVTEG